ncbi:Hsp33 family molecular chaperone HslO, partial [Klebsiella pneumoniae]|uniref:Hsp33 family molecular chaperone HslO n=1 Tax=Klebsiella pneumoniae TaxID=573 RepID=UPI003F1F5DBD
RMPSSVWLSAHYPATAPVYARCEPMTANSDSLIRFLLPDAGVRGVHVRLQATWQEILSHAQYPDAAAELLGEACVAA